MLSVLYTVTVTTEGAEVAKVLSAEARVGDMVRVKLVQELDGAELFQGTLIKGEPRTFTKRGSLLLTATALQNVDIEINGKHQPNPYSGYDRVQIP